MINVYSVWTDPYFYIAAAVFALALFSLVFSIRKFLELDNNTSDFEEADDAGEEVQGELSLAEDSAEDSDPGPVSEEFPAPVESRASVEPETVPGEHSRAEEFVKGLYGSLASLDDRIKKIESNLTNLSSSKVNRDYPEKFLEDMVADFDSLDKSKIKSRIEYLLGELKK